MEADSRWWLILPGLALVLCAGDVAAQRPDGVFDAGPPPLSSYAGWGWSPGADREALPGSAPAGSGVAPTGSSSRVEPSPDAAASTTSGLDGARKLAGPVVFHWFEERRGQALSAWLPLEGRPAWDGSVEFWSRQDRLVVESGFNFIFFDVAWQFPDPMRNHLLALRAARDAGREVPLVAPFFAPEAFECAPCRRDFGGVSGFGGLLEAMRRWFSMALPILGPEGLATVDGRRVLVGLWFLPGAETAPASMLDEMGAILERELGVEPWWSTHQVWAGAGADEVNFLFNGLVGMQAGSRRNADLLVGFWNVGQAADDRFLARAAGATYETAWLELLERRDEFDRVYVESWNEYTESSGLYPAVPTGHTVWDDHRRVRDLRRCLTEYCHLTVHDDFWGTDPYLYTRISAEMTGRFFTAPSPPPD